MRPRDDAEGANPAGEASSDPLDALAESVTEGRAVDWARALSESQDPASAASIRGLQDLARVADSHRRLQSSGLPAPSRPEHGTPGDSTAPDQWGPLTLLELVRAGASGEIWRAWDVWLQREVALKFLSAPHTVDGTDQAAGDLLDEARALARVRHPGVVAVYGIAAHAGRVGLWMELLHGPTLEMEIERRGRFECRDVVEIGLALSRALEAVEAAGIVHRDIKPANIVLEADGRAVLTDFGLGRRRSVTELTAWRTSGTPMFMSPDLLAGEPPTAQSDVYALGVTLRWMLTGRAPFQARTLNDLQVEAARGPATALRQERPDAPMALVRAIERAMAPRAEHRYGSASQLAVDLDAIRRRAALPRARRALLWTGAVAPVAAIAAGIALIPGLTRKPSTPPHVKFVVQAPLNTVLDPNVQAMAIGPDGRTLALTPTDSAGVRHLWVQRLSDMTPHRLPGTEDAVYPFWSPDGNAIGFFADAKLKVVELAGRPPRVLCDAPDARGASWGKNGVIVFAPVPTGPICRIPAAGGEVTVILQPDSAQGERALRWPEFLPDGEHFLFVTLPPRGQEFDLWAGSIDSGDRRRVMSTGAAPSCAGDAGLIIARDGQLLLQPFDYRALRPRGDPRVLGPASSSDVSVGQNLASASKNGVFVQPTASLATTQLVWLDRTGRELGTLRVPEGRYERVSFSADGRRLVAVRRVSPNEVDLWMIDVEREQATRFTHESQSRIGGAPAWTPDGRQIAFSSNRDGPTNIYWKAANGTGVEELLHATPELFKEVNSWSSDARYLLFETASPQTKWDVWMLDMWNKGAVIPCLQSKFNETVGRVSPNGKWVAYASDLSGRREVYVRSFPEPGEEFVVTTEGGYENSWTADGKELLVWVLDNARSVWSVPVEAGSSFRVAPQRLLFQIPAGVLSIQPTPAGDRFLASVPSPRAERPAIAVEANAGAFFE